MSVMKEKCPKSLFLVIKCVYICPCLFVCMYVCFLCVGWRGGQVCDSTDWVVRAWYRPEELDEINHVKRHRLLFQTQSSEFNIIFMTILNLRMTNSLSSLPKAPKSQVTCPKLHQPILEHRDGHHSLKQSQLNTQRNKSRK